jgi:hypothetical protein
VKAAAMQIFILLSCNCKINPDAFLGKKNCVDKYLQIAVIIPILIITITVQLHGCTFAKA